MYNLICGCDRLINTCVSIERNIDAIANYTIKIVSLSDSFLSFSVSDAEDNASSSVVNGE